jgi:large subunit ribosomal protein L30
MATKTGTKKAAKATATIKIKMIGSLIGCTDKQRQTVRGLGLRRLHQVVERADTPEVRGMVKAVPHLVSVVDRSFALVK